MPDLNFIDKAYLLKNIGSNGKLQCKQLSQSSRSASGVDLLNKLRHQGPLQTLTCLLYLLFLEFAGERASMHAESSCGLGDVEAGFRQHFVNSLPLECLD